MAVERLLRELNQSTKDKKVTKLKEIERQAQDLLDLYIACINKKIQENAPNYKDFDQANYGYRRSYKDGRISMLEELKTIIGKGE